MSSVFTPCSVIGQYVRVTIFSTISWQQGSFNRLLFANLFELEEFIGELVPRILAQFHVRLLKLAQ